jgi:hypothetical protein
MDIQQFAKQLEQEAGPSQLMEALQTLRMCSADQLRDRMRGGLMLDWNPWSDHGLAQTPQIYVKRPELRS